MTGSKYKNIFAALVIAAALCMSGAGLLLLGGCKSSGGGSGSGPRIYDSQFPDISRQAYDLAVVAGGMEVNQPKLNVVAIKWAEGQVQSSCGWKGFLVSADWGTGIEGGHYQNSNIMLALTDGQPWLGDWRCRPDVHELQHWIYKSHGIPLTHHHQLMEQRGYRVR